VHLNIGIAQGSPLSSILFAFYTSSILEHFDKTLAKLAMGKRVVCFAYADDFNILIKSSSFQDNCSGLTHVHKGLMEAFGLGSSISPVPRKGSDLTRAPVFHLGVEFGPDKYGLIHYQRQARKVEDLPKPRIPNLPDNVVKSSQKLLGVVIDSGLKFLDHCIHVSLFPFSFVFLCAPVLFSIEYLFFFVAVSSSCPTISRPHPDLFDGWESETHPGASISHAPITSACFPHYRS
jgi:hypothetical protein